MLHFEASIEGADTVHNLLYTIEHLDDFVVSTTKEAVYSDIAPVVLPEAMAEPGAVARPIQWTSAKQRRYVMMKIRKGEIQAPYVRTHAVSRGWNYDVTVVEGDYTEVSLSNKASYFRFVEGINQQRFHANTGWLSAPAKASQWLAITLAGLQSAFERKWHSLIGQ